jgi:hypothetical protein
MNDKDFAPLLLEALQKLHDDYIEFTHNMCLDGGDSDALEFARDVIYKVTGKKIKYPYI